MSISSDTPTMDLPTPNPNILPEAFEDDDEKNNFEQLLISSPTPNPNILPEAFEDDDEKNDFEQLLISSPINDINFWADLIKKNQKFFQLLLFWTVSLRIEIISIKSQIRSMNIDSDVFSTEFLTLIPALVNLSLSLLVMKQSTLWFSNHNF